MKMYVLNKSVTRSVMLANAIRRALLIAALTVPTLLLSCEGPEGAIGPKGDEGKPGEVGSQGPKGDQGGKGDKGEKGDKGDKGDAGTSSTVFQISYGPTVSDNNGKFQGTSWLVFPGANMTAIEKGVILCYVKSNDFWYPVPNKLSISTVDNMNYLRDILFSYKLENGSITYLVQVAEASGLKYKLQDTRIVFVPTTTARLNAEADWGNYEEIQRTFNLPK